MNAVGSAQWRAELRHALVTIAPWIDDERFGPRNVDAGSCTRCADHPRLLATCGPATAEALCRACAEQLGDDAWCDGHRGEGRQARRWAAQLGDDWPSVVILWWVATGELRVDPDELDRHARCIGVVQ